MSKSRRVSVARAARLYSEGKSEKPIERSYNTYRAENSLQCTSTCVCITEFIERKREGEE